MNCYWRSNLPYYDSIPSQIEYLGKSHILNYHTFIHESTYLSTDRSARSVAQMLNECKQETKRRPVLCLDSNPYWSRDFIDDLSREIDSKDYFVLSGNMWDVYTDKLNVAYWPTFLISQQQLVNYQTTDKLGRISFISRIPRAHRLELWINIKDHVRPEDYVVINRINYDLVDKSPYINQLPWSNQSTLGKDNDPVDGNLHNNRHPAYDCCVNITGETDCRSGMIFLTEKTWKAYRSSCLVVNFGSPDTVDMLRRMGIWIWDEFDADVIIQDKIAQITLMFQRDDIKDLYNQNIDNIRQNQNLVTDKKFAYNLCGLALEKLE